jgi:hypothetical protein
MHLGGTRGTAVCTLIVGGIVAISGWQVLNGRFGAQQAFGLTPPSTAAAWPCSLLGAAAEATQVSSPGRTAAPEQNPKGGETLPIRRVILYSSGVGYFEREGYVEGNQTIVLQLRVGEVNDFLKSLIVQDLDGGHVTSVNYGSRDPITRTLKSFAIDLTENPSLAQLLRQLRGEPVRVETSRVFTGTVVSIESKQVKVGENSSQEKVFLNLLTPEGGIVSIDLDQVQSLRIENERLAQELRQALQTLALAHDTEKRTVVLRCTGEGKRRLRVGYVREVPIWKTTYRLAIQGNKAVLQGWAIVENATDEDWSDVQMGLVSGRPVSFQTNLYEPIYAMRPLVPVYVAAIIRPPVYEAALHNLQGQGPGLSAADPQDRLRRQAQLETKAAAQPAAPTGGYGVPLGERADAAVDVQAFRATVPAVAVGQEFGEQFQYLIHHPVLLPRQQSALLPILGVELDVEKVSLYNEGTLAKHPLRGVRFKNVSGAYLMAGPISVLDEGIYAGDAQIADAPQGRDCLLAYAIDTDVEIAISKSPTPQELTSVRINRGVLIARRRQLEEKTYRVRHRGDEERALLIEHPLREGWELIEPKEPAEKTRSFYRFRLKVAPKETTQLVVRESRDIDEWVQLANITPDVIQLYVRAQKVSPGVKESLQKLLQLMAARSEAQARKAHLERLIQEIFQEQGRIRENMARLTPSSDLYQRYLKKFEQQETQLEQLRSELRKAEAQEREAQRALDEFLSQVTVE